MDDAVFVYSFENSWMVFGRNDVHELEGQHAAGVVVE